MVNNFNELQDLATTLLRNKEYARAKSTVGHYCRAHPDDADGQFLLGFICERSKDYARASKVYARAADLSPGDVEPLYRQGLVDNERGEGDAALGHFERALVIDKDYVPALFEAAKCHAAIGSLDVAEQYLRRVIDLRPAEGMAYYTLSHIRRSKMPGQDIDCIKDVLNKGPVSLENSIYLNFALAKIYDDDADYANAMRCYDEANRLKRSTYSYNLVDELPLYEGLKNQFSQEFFASRKRFGVVDKTPIFIVGMMRSGTSLVEQIISSHPDVYGAGELYDLSEVVVAMLGRKLSDPGIFPAVDGLRRKQVKECAAEYIKRLRQHSSVAMHITDKMPMNFLLIGFIRLMFPQAKIVHCVRDPVDTCLSCYMQFFSGDVKFAYNQKEMAGYYRLYLSLMEHWRTIAPDNIFDLDYDRLVHEPGDMVRSLLAYCGLDWHEACLDFQDNKRRVATLSVAQVRKPMYTDSSKKWRRYSQYITDMTNALPSAHDE